MKNAKKILIFIFALVALTLVMSLSIFAEESTELVECEHTYDWNIVGCPKCGTLAVLDEGSTNVSSNLGYKILFATTLSDLSNTNYDVIRLKNNISLNSGDKITNANAIIDLGGNVLYRNGGWLGLRVVAAKGFVNGYVYKTNGGSQIMAVTSLEFMEDVTLAANSTKTNNATGLLMNTDGAYLGSMKNVTICAGILSDLNSNNFDFVNVGTNGIYNHGIEATKGTIGSMENVKISTYGQAITSAAKIGTMTNCVFSGDNIALNITTLQSEMEFVNCEIHSKNLAIYIANAAESTEEAPVSFEIGNTKFVTDGAVYDISSHIIGNEIFADLTSAKALVNGRLYTSLEDAVNALTTSTEEVTTFALIGDLAVNSTIVIDKKVNFSFGGASYDVPVYGTNQVAHKTVSGYTVTSSVDVVFNVVEGGNLTISGAGTLKGGETAIVADGGVVVIAAGTYEGYNPREFVSAESCVVNNNGVYTIAAEHDYDDDVGADKTNYQVDGVCNNCGFVRGIYAVDNIYYMTLEDALAAAETSGKQIVLAADIVLDGDVVWDFTGLTFNFNNLTVTVNGTLTIVGGTFNIDVTEYIPDDYCCAYKVNKGYVIATEHNWVPGESADATCTTPGTLKYECSDCGTEKTEETTATIPHTYDWRIGGCPMCGTVAVPDVEGGKVSTNLGYTVFFAANWSEINANVSASSTYKVIKLTADTTVPSGNNYAKVQNANIIIDLGGHSITSSVGLAPLYLYAADALVNGTIIHNYGRQALYVCNVNLIENIKIIVGGTYANNTTAVLLANNSSYAAGFENSTGSYIGKIKNLTIDSKRDANGNYIENIGLFNHGLEFSNASSIIGDLENVKVYSRGQAITIMAKEIGTMTNCVFDGTNIGLNIGNLQCDINLVNCVVSSETLAVRIGGASSSELSFNFDENTAISSNGSVYYIPDSIKAYEGFESLTTAVALVNGVLYGTLEDALAAVLSSTEEVTTFTLIGDLTLDAPIEINKNVIFSFGGGTFKIPTTGDKTFTEVTAAGYTVTASNGAFVVAEGGALTITGDGKLVGNENAIVADGGEVLITAGTYEGYDPLRFVSSNSCVANNDGVYTVAKEHTYDDGVLSDKVTYKIDGICDVCGFVRGVACVDYVYYATFEEALEVAKNGNEKTITLIFPVTITVDTTYDLSGITINSNEDVFIVTNGATLTLNGDGKVNAGQSGVGSWCAIWANGGHAIINGGTYSVKGDATEGVDPNHQNDLIYTKNDGTVTIYGGTFKYTEGVWTLNQNDKTGGAIVVYGGTFEGFDPANNVSEGADTSFLADGYHSIASDNKYTVGAHNVVIDASKDATCTETGLTEGSHCSICGEIFVEQEVIDVKEHNYVAGEQAEDGSVTYTCVNGCEDAYVINNAALNGEYFMGPDASIVFANGVVTMQGVSYNYTYNETTGTLTVEGLEDGILAYVNSKVVYMGRVELHQHNADEFITEVTTPTCTEAGYTTYICQYCGPLFTADEVEATGHSYNAVVTDPTCETNGYTTYTCTACGDTYTGDVVEALGHSYVEAERVPSTSEQQGHVVYSCSVCGSSYTEDLPIIEHTHTEVEIPAVLPTPSADGYTAGIMCSECGEIIVAPVANTVTLTPSYKTFGISTTNLILGNNISLDYKVNVANGYELLYMVFVFEDVEYAVTEYVLDGGKPVFNFAETRPHKIATNISAYVYAKTADGYSYDVYDYSVMKYCITKLKKNEAVNVISDLLVFGAATQKYVAYRTNTTVADEDLITSLVEAQGYTLTPSTFTSIPASAKLKFNDIDANDSYEWKTSTVVLGSSTEMVYKFAATDITGLQIKIEVDGVEMMMFDASDTSKVKYDESTKRYTVSVNCVSAVQYGSEVKATFIINGVESDSIAYSINGFLYNNLSKNEGTVLGDLMKALYMYGATTYDYFYNTK